MKFYSHLLIFSFFLVSLVSVGQDLIPFENRGTGLWGFRTQKTGRVDIECWYDEVGGFSDSFSSVRIGQLWGFINQKGEMVIEPKFDWVGNFTDGQVWVRNSDGSFLMDVKEKISVSIILVIPLIYDDVGSFSEGLCEIEKDGKWGFIGKK